MNQTVQPVALFVLSVLGYLAMTAFLSRIRKGTFRVLRHNPQAVTLVTDLGEFSVDSATRTFTAIVSGQHRSIPFESIRALRYGFKEESAWLSELAFGIDLWDIFSRWTDKCEWYAISVIVDDGPEIAMFVAGQLEHREPFVGWWYRLLNGLFTRVHIRQDLDEYSRAVLEQILDVFSAAGHRLRLA